MTCSRFQHAYDAYARLDAGFAEASALWQVGDRIHFDPAWLGMFQEMGDAFNDYVQCLHYLYFEGADG